MKYTKEEIRKIEKLYTKHNCQQISKMTGRTEASIYHVLSRNNIKNTKEVKLKDRFLKNINKNTNNGCWEWVMARNKWGYGRTGYRGKTYAAHRISMMIFKGFDINSKLCICHKCDNRRCVNPKHLFIGTYKDNIRDMFRKGRNRNQNGENNSQSKLREEQVREIRKSYKKGNTRWKLTLQKISPLA